MIHKHSPAPSGSRGSTGAFSRRIAAWFALLPDGHMHSAYELKGSQTTPNVGATQMVEITRRLVGTGRLRYVAYDPSMANKTGQDMGKAIVEHFHQARLPMRKGMNARGKNGWANLHAFLAEYPDGTPWLTFEPSCTYAIRTLPIQEQSEHDADDLDSDGDDHFCDCARYAMNSRPSPTTHPTDNAPKRGGVAWDIQQLRDARASAC